MAFHKYLTGLELHDPKGTAENGPLELSDNTYTAYQIKEGATESYSYIKIDTADSNEAVTIGNTTSNPKVVIPGSGNVGIGTDSPAGILHTVVEGAPSTVIVDEYRSSASGPHIYSRHARGTKASPENSNDADDCLSLFGVCYNSGSFYDAGRIAINVDGAPSSDSPGRITFETTPAGSYTPAERMRIDKSGNVGIGVTNPTKTLDVNGTLKVAGIISGVATPTASDEAASKGYVDSVVTGGGGDADFDSLVVDTNTLVVNADSYLDKVGIGTATPAATLEVSNSAGGVFAKFRGSNDERLSIYQVAPDDWHIYPYRDTDSSFKSLTLGDAAVKILSTGNVGIGTSAPDKALEINSSAGNNLRLTYNDSTGSAANYADFAMSSGGDLTITPSGGDVTVAGTVTARCVVNTESDSSTINLDAATYANTTLLVDTVALSASSTVTLSDEAGSWGVGATVRIKDSTGGANSDNVAISPDGSETMDGANGVTIDTNYGWVELLTDGTNWFIVAGDGYSKD